MFISPNYFSYPEIIKKEMISQGCYVDWMNDRPNDNILDKCIIRVNKKLLKSKIDQYFYNKIMPQVIEKKYDIVFVILGQSFTKEMFEFLKKESPETKLILYLWDSIKNFPSLLDLSKAFDEVYSFDRLDCDNNNFTFLPLFYNSENEVEQFELIYDISFIGTIKKGKLTLLNKLRKELELKYKNNCFVYYLQSKLVYFYNKLTNKEFKKAKISDFSFKKIPYKENVKISLSSKIIIDVPMENQNGLSMRTFESIAYKKKLITTNSSVENYDFYNPVNIYIYKPGERIDFDSPFFTEAYIEIPKNISEKYSLENWVKNFLN